MSKNMAGRSICDYLIIAYAVRDEITDIAAVADIAIMARVPIYAAS